MLGSGLWGRVALVAAAAGAIACGSNTVVPAGTAGAGGAGDGGSGGAGGTWDGVGPNPAYLPEASGACPAFTNGSRTFAPAGIAPREVQIYVGDAPGGGPLVFYWHGTGSVPAESLLGLGDAFQPILDAGGVVAAPYHDTAAGTFPWFLTDGGEELDDLLVADEVLACAISQLDIDTSRIHSAGMSAGGLQTVQFSYHRSGYLASVAPYSGGLIFPAESQDETNKFAAMIFHGGPNDEVVVNFKQLSEAYHADLTDRGQFSFICDHGMEHALPPPPGPAGVGRFFQDHPFGTDPSPYPGAGLPSGFPEYCSL